MARVALRAGAFEFPVALPQGHGSCLSTPQKAVSIDAAWVRPQVSVYSSSTPHRVAARSKASRLDANLQCNREIMLFVDEPKFQLSQPPALFARVDDEPEPLDEFGQSILTSRSTK